MKETCDRCGEEMELYDSPEMKELFRIPFTQKFVAIMDYGKKEPMCFCRTEDNERRQFEEVASVGYEKAQEDYRRGRWD